MDLPTTSTSLYYNVPQDIQEPAHDPYGPAGTAYPSTAMGESSSTLYVPIASPPTPAPSPRLSTSLGAMFQSDALSSLSCLDPAHLSRREFANLANLGSSTRQQYLISLLSECTPSELLFISTTIAPLLKRDFLKELPPELSIYILCFIDEPRTLTRASQVSRYWQTLLSDEWTWKRMCDFYQFDRGPNVGCQDEGAFADPMKMRQRTRSSAIASVYSKSFSYRKYFKYSYRTMLNWRRKGHLLRSHRIPVSNPDSGVITSVALDAEWVVVGLANCRIHVFSAKTGVLSRTLIGHEQGVWAVNLVSRGGYWAESTTGSGKGNGRRRKDEDDPCIDEDDLIASLSSKLASMSSPIEPPGLDHLVPPSLRTALGLDERPNHHHLYHENGADADGDNYSEAGAESGKRSDECCATEGWGQPNALVVSGGCDKILRVWDVKSGYCIYVLRGHTSTIRCLRVLHNRPVAVTGSRDSTLRVWDIQRGWMLRVLHGHQQSVRCLDVWGNRVVSGSYDTTLRLWDVDTGECLHVLRGHFQQIYSVVFDGVHIASGGLDTSVRVWDASSGHCIALLQGHTALVCQLQLGPGILATGGSDGRVITFSLSTFAAVHRIAAHDSSVTSLQFDKHFLVTGGNDGRVKLFETKTGNYVRELTEPCESVWKAAYRKDMCAIMCKRAGKTVMEIWSFKPSEEVYD